MTFYSFSTENWNRSTGEIFELQSLLNFFLDTESKTFFENKINFSFIGNIERFNNKVKKKLIDLKKETKKFNNLYIILALNYGSRDEILMGFKKILKKKNLKVTKKDISESLMTRDHPDPDLVIRTSGEKRVSNFLLWQIAYSE